MIEESNIAKCINILLKLKKTIVSTITIENEIIEFIAKVTPEKCYIGITNNIGRRFVEHGIIEKDTAKPRDSRIVWLHRNAGSESNARSIEKIFLDRLPGKIRNGFCRERKPTYVYVYTPILGVTNENI